MITMEAIRVKLLPTPAESPDVEKCIICQTSSDDATISTSNGRKRIRDAAEIREDSVAKRLKYLESNDEHFVYHMTNDCYKSYTMKKNIR